MPHFGNVAASIALTALPILTGCSAERAPISDHSLTELCERPTQFFAQVWHFAEPIVGEPGFVDRANPGKVGAGSGCAFTANGALLAHVSVIRFVPGLHEPPDTADTISVGEQLVKAWDQGDGTALLFETDSDGWKAGFSLTVGADLKTNKPQATSDQIDATAKELVEILGEFKGPDRKS